MHIISNRKEEKKSGQIFFAPEDPEGGVFSVKRVTAGSEDVLESLVQLHS